MAKKIRTYLGDPKKAKKFFEDKLTFTTGPAELRARIQRGEVVIVDVRASEDYIKEHIPGAINLPSDRWRLLKGLSKRKTNAVYCYTQSCHLAARAALFFASKGYPVIEMEGGFEAWKEYEFEVETGGYGEEAEAA